MAKRVERTRGHGTMTEAGFRGWIMHELRRLSLRWPPRQKVKEMAKRPYKGSNKRLKYVYLCASCGELFPNSEIHVDHVQPVGEFLGWDIYFNNLFCEADNLQCLCINCHAEKTKKENDIKHSKTDE